MRPDVSCDRAATDAVDGARPGDLPGRYLIRQREGGRLASDRAPEAPGLRLRTSRTLKNRSRSVYQRDRNGRADIQIVSAIDWGSLGISANLITVPGSDPSGVTFAKEDVGLPRGPLLRACG